MKDCRVFHGDWIVEQIKASARLRMLVPRVVRHSLRSEPKQFSTRWGTTLFDPTASYQSAVKAPWSSLSDSARRAGAWEVDDSGVAGAWVARPSLLRRRR